MILISKNKTKRKLIFTGIVLYLGMIIVPLVVSAAYDYTPMEEIPGFGIVKDFPTYILDIYKFGIWTVGIAAMLMIIIGGFMYMTAAGNTSKTGTAKTIITDAIYGLVVALAAYLLLFIINPDLVNVNINMAPVGTGSGTSSGGGSSGGGGGGGGTGGGGGGATPTCSPGTGNCSEANRSCFGSQARNASIVCQAESGGQAGIPSGVDKCGSTSASWGVMQINITCHNIGGNNCTSAFSCCYNGTSCNKSTCQVKDAGIANKCIQAASNPQTNTQYACNMYNSGGWRQWGAARRCGVN